MVGDRKVFVSSPYPEGAARAIARSAHERGVLAGVATADFKQRASRAPSPWPPVPHFRLTTAYELGRLFSKAAHLPRLTSALMFRQHADFDRAFAAKWMKDPKIRRADVLIGMPGASAETFEVARAQGTETVLHCVNSLPWDHNEILRHFHPQVPRQELVPPSEHRQVAREIELADLCLVPSAFVAEQLLAAGADESRIRIHPYGVDTDFFSGRPFRPFDGRLAVLFVGQISYRKGIAELLLAARSLGSQIEVTLVGPIVSPRLLKNLPDNVRYRSPGNRADVRDVMHKSDLFVLPTLEDSYGLVVPEALAAGLPVITTTNAGSAHLLDAACGRVIAPGAVDELAAAISEFLCADTREAASGASRARALGGQSWSTYSAATLADMRVPR